jgi:hypothetical protein
MVILTIRKIFLKMIGFLIFVSFSFSQLQPIGSESLIFSDFIDSYETLLTFCLRLYLTGLTGGQFWPQSAL